MPIDTLLNHFVELMQEPCCYRDMYLSSNQLEIRQTDSPAAAPDHHGQCQDHHRQEYQIHTDRAQPGRHLQSEERFYQEEIQVCPNHAN